MITFAAYIDSDLKKALEISSRGIFVEICES